jgi:ribosomal protein L22
MSTPGDPQQGKPRDEEQTEAAAEEAKQAGSTDAPAGDAPADAAPAEETAAAPQAEGTAADVTGVGKDAAAAALREGSSEPVADADADAEADDDTTDTADADAEEAAPAGRRRGRRGRRGRGAGAEEDAAPATPEPAPTRRAPARRDGELVVVRAQAKYVRTSARKARLVCDHIRGKSVEEARAILAHTPRAVARDWSKLLESAIANAEHNHELVGDELRIHAVTADEGPTLKRFRPRAMGRATRIRKRTSHLTITLTPKE